MLYDKHRTYAHHAHLPFAHEPLKSLYVFQRLISTLLLVPCWILYYSVLPQSFRPRPSWSLKQIVNIKFTRRVYRVTEVAGVTWGTRDPEAEPDQASLKETVFQWVPPLEEELRTGVVISDCVPFKRVGTFVWSSSGRQGPQGSYQSTYGPSKSPPLVGIFFHGGGYCHLSADEKSGTSRIPRRLIRDKLLSEIYAVEYRLMQHAPFPATIQDGAAVYADIVKHYGADDSGQLRCRIVLIGDSSGGNLALAVARWVRDEGRLPSPHALLLLSPSCDISHCFPEPPSAFIPRPHDSIDYLPDTHEPRALLQRTFLGFARRGAHADRAREEARFRAVVHSEYVSPAGAQVLRRWGHVPADEHGGSVPPAFGRRTGDEDSEGCNEDERAGSAGSSQPSSQLGHSDAYARGGLFGGFPKTLVVAGDAERLEREVRNLVAGMEGDGVDVRTVWARDAAHDILIMAGGWWDETVRESVWRRIGEWIEEVQC